MIRLKALKGMVPAMSDERRPAEHASYAMNVDFAYGDARPIRKNEKVAEKTKVGAIYEGDCCLVTVEGCATLAEGGISCNGLIYKTETGKPMQVASEKDACQGNWCNVGHPCGKRPTAVVIQNGPTPSKELESEYTSVAYTYVNKYGQETSLSDPTDPFLIRYGSKIRVSDFTAPKEGHCIEEIIVYAYRKGAYFGGEKDNPQTGDWFRLGSIKPNQTYGDFIYGQPGDAILSPFHHAPPDGLKQIATWRTGQMIGLVGRNQVAFSMKNAPFAWPGGYRMVHYGRGLRLLVGRNYAYVLTDEAPFVIELATECEVENCHRAQHYHEPLPCIAPMAAAISGDSVVYPTPEGMVMLTGLKANYTQILDKQTMGEIQPSALIGAIHNGYYYGFHVEHGKSVRFSLERPQDTMTFLEENNVTAVHAGKTGLYLAVKGKGVYRFAESEEDREMEWRRHWTLPVELAMSSYRVDGVFNEAEVKHYDAEEMIDQESVAPYELGRLPLYGRSREIGVSIRLNHGHVTGYRVAMSAQELAR